ncbi:MAG: GNAT family N-acetyltransferase [Rhodospirillales bacterium]|nr:GNAT family N-acetyltransferase [Rhodospirillales bacterium]
MTDASLSIAIENPDTPETRAMLEASDAYMAERYPPANNYMLDVSALQGRDITFLVARKDGAAIGCGAIVRKAGYAEIKRMWVAPEARGLKLGRRLLDELEAVARAEAIPALMLEAGDEQPEAMGLYAAAGFTRRGAFGDYPEGPPSVFMEKRLG